jgi:hypothetical protein
MQDIASWQQSAAEARRAGNLGDRPLVALSGRQAPVSTEYPGAWTDLQVELAGLSTRGTRRVVNQSDGELIYEAPEVVVEAARQVLDEVRRGAAKLR